MSAPRCATSALVVWLDTEGSGAAGSAFYKLHFTNLRRACTLRGYAGVSAVDLGGHQLGSAASRNHARTPRLITLGRGATATAILQVVNVGNFSPAACRPTTAAGLRVYPPGSTASKIVPFPFRACSRHGPGFLTTQALQKP